MHAAGLFIGNGTSLLVREDIGRHNAVDKVYGCWSRNGSKPPLALLLSGRCGWDIVAKAASMGTSMIASFGAASSLAADAARWANITLVSFVRDGKAVVIGPVDGRFERKH
jgi:FdhD protein